VLAEQDRLLTLAQTSAQSGNTQAQFTALEQAETLGSAKAALELGKIYTQGQSAPMDREKGFKHYNQAATLGSADGKITASLFNMYGIGTAKNQEAGIDLMKDAAKDDKRAKREMGLFYGNLRLPFLNNDSKGLKYLAEAAEEGDADAAYYLSVLATRVDKPALAKTSLKEASNMGQPKAQLQLGREAMAQGNYMNARDLFLKSAKSNDSEAMFELGKGLSEGKFPKSSSITGVTSTMEAYAWLLGSSSQKHLQAKELLAVVETKLATDDASKKVLGSLIADLQGQITPWNSN
jgi:TPR repeat protein